VTRRLVALAEEFLKQGGGRPEAHGQELRRLVRPVAARAVLELAGGGVCLSDDERYALAVLVVAAGASTVTDVVDGLPGAVRQILGC
jgi:hypothetical protein